MWWREFLTLLFMRGGRGSFSGSLGVSLRTLPSYLAFGDGLISVRYRNVMRFFDEGKPKDLCERASAKAMNLPMALRLVCWAWGRLRRYVSKSTRMRPC